MRLPVEWNESEWNDLGKSAWLNGIVGDVHPDMEAHPTKRWAWDVRPSSSRCEYPELFDCGNAPSEEVAKRKATQAMMRADKRYRHIQYD